ncbi:MAG: NAD(P)H-dependent oxidoreductase [Gemmatimonadota bacterium]|jgi:multimeric flavodoxin WrbA
MRAFLMNGGLAGGTGEEALRTVELLLGRELAERGFDVDVAQLREIPVAYCRGCFECWVETPGICRTDDGARDLARRFVGSDLVVFLTPVTFGGYSSELKKALDRSIGLVSPFFRRTDGAFQHLARYERYPALLGVGVMSGPDGEDEELFHTLVERNAHNMHAPAHASAVTYWSEDVGRLHPRLGELLDTVVGVA